MPNGIAAALKTTWRLATPYFSGVSEERWSARALGTSIIVIELALVGVLVRLNAWQGDFFNALQERNWDVYTTQLVFFTGLAAAFIALAVLQYVLNAYLQIRWRRWMTERYLARWLQGGAHYRMKMTGDEADNPDQRIAEDVKLFIRLTLGLGLRIFGQAVTLASFVVVLWVLSTEAPVRLFDVDLAIPGHLVWAALIYAVIGTAVAHLIGRRLIQLNFREQRFEADFRFALVRVRENGEAIAVQKGEPTEVRGLLGRFRSVIGNAIDQMNVQKWLTGFTAMYNQAAVIIPYVLVAPAYFLGVIQLGALMRTASAFAQVQTAFSVFVDAYAQLAEWKSVVDRLAGFHDAVDHASDPSRVASRIDVITDPGDAFVAEGLRVDTPSGTPIVRLPGLALKAGERRTMSGPSGSGKTSLLRGLSGAWPWGHGRVRVPRGSKVLVLPQRPYLPLGTLRAALTYPAAPHSVPDADVRATLDAMGLGALAVRLDAEENWAAVLSGGEQQRVALARAALAKPDWLLLDEATAALDPEMERRVLEALVAELPSTGMIAISHRETTPVFTAEPLRIEPQDKGPALARA